MTLILADRVDMFESMITAALHGRPDNYVREKGWAAYLAYDRGRARKVVLIGAAAVGAIVAGLVLKRVLTDD